MAAARVLRRETKSLQVVPAQLRMDLLAPGLLGDPACDLRSVPEAAVVMTFFECGRELSLLLWTKVGSAAWVVSSSVVESSFAFSVVAMHKAPHPVGMVADGVSHAGCALALTDEVDHLKASTQPCGIGLLHTLSEVVRGEMVGQWERARHGR